MSKEFNRKPRSITEIKRWKATEFRQFLLYTGPIVLKLVLEEEYKSMYEHFLSLSIGISILLSPKFSKIKNYFTYSKNLLKHFVNDIENIYG